MAIKLLAAPAAEAVTLDEAKAHMRIDIADDDAIVTGLIAAARETIENLTGRKLITQKWRVIFDRFTRDEVTFVAFNRLFVRSVFDIAANHLTPDSTRVIRIPMAPLQSIDLFTVIDSANASADFDPANFIADIDSEPARIVLKQSSDWPYPAADLATANAVHIDFTAGYGLTGAAVPESLKLAIKMLAAHWYENREHTSPLTIKEVPMSVGALIQNYRLYARGMNVGEQSI